MRQTNFYLTRAEMVQMVADANPPFRLLSNPTMTSDDKLMTKAEMEQYIVLNPSQSITNSPELVTYDFALSNSLVSFYNSATNGSAFDSDITGGKSFNNNTVFSNPYTRMYLSGMTVQVTDYSRTNSGSPVLEFYFRVNGNSSGPHFKVHRVYGTGYYTMNPQDEVVLNPGDVVYCDIFVNNVSATYNWYWSGIAFV